MPQEPSTDEYLIWSNEHGKWWRAGHRGYSRALIHAGRYSREQAIAICRLAIPSAAHIGVIAEIPVRVADVEEFVLGQNLPKAFMPEEWEV